MTRSPKPDTKYVAHLPGNAEEAIVSNYSHLKEGNRSSLQVQAWLIDHRVRGGVSNPQRPFSILIKIILIEDFETVYIAIECGPVLRYVLLLQS